MRRLIVDTDTASDDAVALVMALTDDDCDVMAITTVAGNVGVEQAAQNALFCRELVGAATPVHAGAAKPLLRRLHTAVAVHGEDGMGDIGLPLSGRAVDAEHAVDAILRLASEHRGDLELVTLGPLTNVAIALAREPRLAEWITTCTVMGGAGDGQGNVTAVAEFNFWVDPHATQLVLASGLRTRLVGWDVSRRRATIADDEAADLVALGPLGAFSVDIQASLRAFAGRDSGLGGFGWPDPLAMAVALDPRIVTRAERLHVEVQHDAGPGLGQAIVDRRASSPMAANADVVLDVDREAFMRRVRAALSGRSPAGR